MMQKNWQPNIKNINILREIYQNTQKIYLCLYMTIKLSSNSHLESISKGKIPHKCIQM